MTRVSAEDPGAADSLELMAELSAVLAAITGDSGQSSFDPEDVRGPLACFAVARSVTTADASAAAGAGNDASLPAGQALGCGAFRPLEQGVAEIKRMYARPGHPGTGSAILAFLEAEAARMGYRALRLSTRRVNTRAVAFYEARGYRIIPNFGRYTAKPESVCFQKLL
ncbi:GNAT family N-acetyltransferase [Pseudoduganella sp. LjRoot289]|uniref:GNAT family N-acetyltransferase n=1 Tax=Pseudoduganella sp. LjRoot289 TaxID=3342314 RepID=UPI003ECC8786